jgi:uncharacterized membrane protein
MTKGRLEAFSDGVIAIIITIMVLELKTPHTADLEALKALAPVLSAYVVSFVYIGIYWNNHHHLLHATDHVDGKILWANLHLLFWLSLVPFVTSWWDETQFAALPTAIYGGILFMAGVAYNILQALIIARQGPNSQLKKAIGRDTKGKLSALLYLASIPVALLVSPWIADGLYLLVALMWLVPDKRIERKMDAPPSHPPH